MSGFPVRFESVTGQKSVISTVLSEERAERHYCRPLMIVRFAPSGALAAELKEKVQAYLEGHDTPALRNQMYAKTAVILIWTALSYVGLVFWASSWLATMLLATSLGLAMAGVGFAIMHDANHGSYPAGPFVRRLLGCTLDLMGGSSYIWRFQHNVNHHSFTNVPDADADIDIGAIARLAPAQPYRAHFRFQHLYVWPFYSLLGVSWIVYADWRDFFGSAIGSNPFPTPKGVERWVFWGGKAAWVVLWLVVPLMVHGPGLWFTALIWTYLVLGFTLSIVFQLAHIVGEAEFPQLEGAPAKSERDFFHHQLATTADFARDNRLLTWYLGGLNYQVEHHLFPKVHHLHYPALSKIVEEVCHKHKAPYYAFPTFRAALGSHARHLYRMGRATEPVEVATAATAKA